MNIKVSIDELAIKEQDVLNSGEYNAHNCIFEFDEAYDGLVKKAVFSNAEHSYQIMLASDECIIPYEILENVGAIEIGVYAYELSGDDLVLRYSPKPITKYINTGSYKEHYDNYEKITPTDKEQMEQMLANINISAEKTDHVATIEITDKDGTTSTVEIHDGQKGDTGAQGVPGNPGPAGKDGIDGKDGADGKDGTNGQDGYTPVRGTDYWTSADIADIEQYCANYIDANITQAIGGEY